MDPLAVMCDAAAARLVAAGVIPDAAKAVGPVDRIVLAGPGSLSLEIFPNASAEEFDRNGPPIAEDAEHSIRIVLTAASERWVPPLFALAHQVKTALLSHHPLWRPANRLPLRCETGPAGWRGEGERPLAVVPVVLTWTEPTEYLVDHPDLVGVTVTAGVPPVPTRFTFSFDLLEA